LNFLLDSSAFLALHRLGRNLALAQSEVLDVVVEECHHPKYCDARRFATNTGLTMIKAHPSWVRSSSCYRSKQTSTQDAINLYYARVHQRILVTESVHLHSICDRENIKSEFHRGFLGMIKLVSSSDRSLV
jgi:hypothetical protein